MPTGEQLAASLGEARTRLSEVRDRAKAVLEVDGGARLLMDNSGMRFNRLFAVWGHFGRFFELPGACCIKYIVSKRAYR